MVCSASSSHEEKSHMRGWLIVALAFLADAISLGARSLFVVVIIYWEDDFGWSVNSLSQLMALVHICNGLATPLSGFFIDKYPSHICIAGGLGFLGLSLFLTALMTATWQIWLVYGVLCGSAYGLLNLNVFSVAVMQQLPPEKHGLAVGIATSGSTFGQFALVPLFTLVTQRFGWRAGYVALAIIAFSLVCPSYYLLQHVERNEACSLPESISLTVVDENLHCNESELPNDSVKTVELVETPSCEVEITLCNDASFNTIPADDIVDIESEVQEIEDIEDGNEDKEYVIWENFTNMKKCPQFTALLIAFFLCGVTTTGFIETHLVKLAVHNDFSLFMGSIAFSVLAACNGVSIVFTGFLVDYLNRHYILATIFFVRGMAYVLLYSFFLEKGGLAALFVFAVFFGIANYSVVPPVVSLIKTYLPKSVGFSTGVLLMFHSVGAAAGAALGGVFFQTFDSYDEAVGVCLVLCLIATVSCLSMQTCGIGRNEKLFRSLDNQSLS